MTDPVRFHTPARVARHLIISALALLAVSAACSGSTNEKLLQAQISEGCLLNTDCTSPLVCAFRRCHTECASSRDCPDDQRCVSSDRPFMVCQLEDERDCTRNSDCPVRMVCGIDGECRDQCATERDCIEGQVCTAGSCADPDELVGGMLPAVPGADASGGLPCSFSADCPNPLVCRAGFCTEQCRDDRDCLSGQTCVSSRCQTGAGGECTFNSDCATAGQICDRGSCRCSCQESRDCAPGQTCDGCGCQGGLVDAGTPECLFNSDCSTGQICASGTCQCECREDRDCGSGERCDGCGCVPMGAPDGAPDGFGSPCNLPSDCTLPLRCVLGACVFECATNQDCQSGTCCFGNQCVTGPVCATSDGGSDAGGPVDGGACVPCLDSNECDDGVFCNGTEVCAAGCCASAALGPCDSQTACIQDICNEGPRTCDHITQAPVDGDGDGQLAIACGGLDCDDGEATVFNGAPELCDGLDNDCNGAIDDASRIPLGSEVSVTIPTPPSNTPASRAGLVRSAGRWISFSEHPSFVGEIWANEFDDAGNPMGTPTLVLNETDIASTSVALRGVESGPTHSAVLVSGLSPWVMIFDTSLTRTGLVTLGPQGSASIRPMDAVWTGSDFFVATTLQDGVGVAGRVTTDGSFQDVVPIPSLAAGNLLSQDRIRVARGTTTSAVAYRDNTQNILVTIIGVATVVAGPIQLSTGGSTSNTVFAVASTPGGYVVLWNQFASLGNVATFIAEDGTVGATTPLPNPGASVVAGGIGMGEGQGAMFNLQYGNTFRSGYVLGAFANPMEIRDALISPGGGAVMPSIAMGDGMTAISSYFASDSTLRWRLIGCR